MTAQEIRKGLDVLRSYFANAKGDPHAITDVQLSVYLDGLARFTPAEFEAASRAWMRKSRWFPFLSDLLELMAGPEVDIATQASLAWAAVERAIPRIGAYASVQFADPAIGECVRQVFGSWPRACSLDPDGPAWAGRRKQFMELYPAIARRALRVSPTLVGLHRGTAPALIPHVEGLSMPTQLTSGDAGPVSRGDAPELLAAITGRVAADRAKSKQEHRA
jgi:hypothetical protein